MPDHPISNTEWFKSGGIINSIEYLCIMVCSILIVEFFSSLFSLRMYHHKIFTVKHWINGEPGGNATLSFFRNLIEMFNAASIKTETKQVRITNKLEKE